MKQVKQQVKHGEAGDIDIDSGNNKDSDKVTRVKKNTNEVIVVNGKLQDVMYPCQRYYVIRSQRFTAANAYHLFDSCISIATPSPFL